jgi:hypothetical protein
VHADKQVPRRDGVEQGAEYDQCTAETVVTRERCGKEQRRQQLQQKAAKYDMAQLARDFNIEGGEGSGRANLPTPCIKLNADPKNITDTTMERNFLRVVTRIVVTADVRACRR